MGSGMGSGTSSLREMKPDPTPALRPTEDGQPYLGGRETRPTGTVSPTWEAETRPTEDGQPYRDDGD
jgi:hypothetical protein